MQNEIIVGFRLAQRAQIQREQNQIPLQRAFVPREQSIPIAANGEALCGRLPPDGRINLRERRQASQRRLDLAILRELKRSQQFALFR